MENTLENKAKFFAQYWGQKVINNEGEKATVGVDYIKHGLAINFLELTPLHLISDEDAIKIGNRCLGLLSGHSYLDEKSIYGNEFYVVISNSSYSPNTKQFGCNVSYLPSDVTDYLRSKGYALPYNGLSVEEQVSRGWVKLRTEI